MSLPVPSERIGYLESAQWLEEEQRGWDQQQLLNAARAAELRNTGWPIGVVLDPPDVSPKPTEEGIEARIGDVEKSTFDFWSLSKGGRFYFLRRFEEDTERLTGITPPPPEHVIWWDVRIWRIAEVLLHSATLYRKLEIPTDAPYMLTINHGGLSGREFSSSRPVTYFTRPGRISRAQSSSWERTVTQDVIIGSLKELVRDVSKGLFVLFDFANVPPPSVDQIVELFLQSRV